MDKPFVGYDKKYSNNYTKIFRKSLKMKIKIFIDKILFDLFLKEIK